MLRSATERGTHRAFRPNVRTDQLHSTAADFGEAGAQPGVRVHHRGECLVQHVRIQCPAQPVNVAERVAESTGIELLQEPQSLLHARQRQCPPPGQQFNQFVTPLPQPPGHLTGQRLGRAAQTQSSVVTGYFATKTDDLGEHGIERDSLGTGDRIVHSVISV